MSDIKIDRKNHLLIVGTIAINTLETPITGIVVVDELDERNSMSIPYLQIITTQTCFEISLTEENKIEVFNELLEYV